MKLYKKSCWIDKETIVLFPTILIKIDEPYYMRHNIQIGFFWLVFAAGMTFMEEE